MINPWRVLGVHRQSTDDEIQAAFREVAWRTHPDHNAKCIQAFQRANEAYSILKDKKRVSLFIKEMIIRNSHCAKCRGAGATFKSIGLTHKTFTACKNCGGAGVIINERDESNVTVKL